MSAPVPVPQMDDLTPDYVEGLKARSYERWRDWSLAERCVEWVQQGRKMANENARAVA